MGRRVCRIVNADSGRWGEKQLKAGARSIAGAAERAVEKVGIPVIGVGGDGAGMMRVKPRVGAAAEGVAEVGAINGIASVATPFGEATQASSVAAMAARVRVSQGATLWRMGTTGQSAAGEAQFWALEHPLSPGFASRYGIPAENVANFNFIESATLRPGTQFVTRIAPAVGEHVGGGVEAVVPPHGVIVRGFTSY